MAFGVVFNGESCFFHGLYHQDVADDGHGGGRSRRRHAQYTYFLRFPGAEAYIGFVCQGLSGFPVMTMNFSPGFRLCASCVSSTISRVLPELEISSNKSFSWRMPRSPCCASLGCRKTEGMPVEQKVVAMFMAICPALPMPEVTSFPFLRCTCSTMSSTALS